jgi:hypothetical protein
VIFGIHIQHDHTQVDKDRKLVNPTMTATHKTVTGIMRIENLRHKVYMDNFSSPELFDTKAINCCGTVRLNQKEMPRNFGKTFKWKQGDLTIILWKANAI